MEAPTAETSKLKVGGGVIAMLIALCAVLATSVAWSITHPRSSGHGWLQVLVGMTLIAGAFGVVLRYFRAAKRQTEPQEEMDGDDIDNLRAWSISAQLAAVPQAYETQVPQEVAALIRAARELHPEMARGARDRDERGEPCPSMG